MLSLTLLALPLLAVASVHDVQVGADGLKFTPEALSANVGDMVVFHFMAKNHTASQSSFASPCGQLDGGFDSGFEPVPPNSTNFPTFTYTVTGTAPVWVHCKQAADTAASHCGAGMVFAINCPTDDNAPNSFSNFKASALAIGAQLQAAANATSATSAAAYPTPTDPVTVTQPTSHVVTVGGNGTLTYDPPHIAAAPGDIISFQFVSKNHTATQSTFGSPCKKIETTSGTPGFDSGFMFIANGSAPTVWNITVNDTNPIWVYCRQKTPADHCGTGMVFAVNSDESANSQKTFSIFQSAAKSEEAAAAANASTAASSGTTPTPSSGASPSMRVSTGLALAIVGAVFGLVL